MKIFRMTVFQGAGVESGCREGWNRRSLWALEFPDAFSSSNNIVLGP